MGFQVLRTEYYLGHQQPDIKQEGGAYTWACIGVAPHGLENDRLKRPTLSNQFYYFTTSEPYHVRRTTVGEKEGGAATWACVVMVALHGLAKAPKGGQNAQVPFEYSALFTIVFKSTQG